MNLLTKYIILNSKTDTPHFIIKESLQNYSPELTIVQVLYFSIDPVMRVWMSGAKTNFRSLKEGDVFNCFGLGKIIHSKDSSFPIN